MNTLPYFGNKIYYTDQRFACQRVFVLQFKKCEYKQIGILFQIFFIKYKYLKK